MNGATLIRGGEHKDQRGLLKFFNDLDMTAILRMYEINPANNTAIRAWQAHKEENKWFYCTGGKFDIHLVKVDDFKEPSRNLKPEKVTLDSNIPVVLHIPGGYATGIKAIDTASKLLVFSNFTTEESKNDDFRFAQDLWSANWY
jgi:dTDP-4-dehydrorhamnose 3,5-epimerase